MLLTEKLQERADFSQVECAIADYILQRGGDLAQDSARHIASSVYTTPSSVVRLCQKLGFAGYCEFRKVWLEEWNYLQSHFQSIDPNYPFQGGDSIAAIGAKLNTLYQECIADTYSLQEPNVLMQAVQYCKNAGTIYLWSAGAQSGIGQAFAEKMAKIGRTVIIHDGANMNYFFASTCQPTDCFLLISYSGETEVTLRIARQLHRRKIPVVVLTSYGGSTLANLFPCRLYLSTRERMVSNLGSFGSHLSALFLLDLIYAGVFAQDFDRNLQFKLEVSQGFEIYRRSDNPLIRE